MPSTRREARLSPVARLPRLPAGGRYRLHAKRWTRKQAIEWFVGRQRLVARGGSPGEIDRYCSWPGQACGYKVGHSEINRLRTRAKAALGGRYDFKAFNDAVVLGGNVPMTVLAHVLDRHIAARKA
jgi:uncharacterized protein (DUF885 family)